MLEYVYITATNRLVFPNSICGFMHKCFLANASEPEFHFHLTENVAEISKCIAVLHITGNLYQYTPEKWKAHQK